MSGRKLLAATVGAGMLGVGCVLAAPGGLLIVCGLVALGWALGPRPRPRPPLGQDVLDMLAEHDARQRHPSGHLLTDEQIQRRLLDDETARRHAQFQVWLSRHRQDDGR